MTAAKRVTAASWQTQNRSPGLEQEAPRRAPQRVVCGRRRLMSFLSLSLTTSPSNRFQGFAALFASDTAARALHRRRASTEGSECT